MDIHARIQQFLQHVIPSPLGRGWRIAPGEGGAKVIGPHPNPLPEGEGITKAGVVPFIRQDTQLSYYFMKPVARHAHLAAPKFQLCKGTRMVRLPDGSWQDMGSGMNGEDIKESLAETALREGIEELGLKLENIKRLFDAGPYGFSSAVTGKGKKMWLFAAEMASQDFSDDVAPTTAECTWLTLDEFAVAGREDHVAILRDIEEKLG